MQSETQRSPNSEVGFFSPSEFGEMQSEMKLRGTEKPVSDLRFEINDPKYLLIHVHIVYMTWALFASL